MIVVSGGKGSGKTTHMMQVFNGNQDSILVVMNTNRKAGLIQQFDIPQQHHRRIVVWNRQAAEKLKGGAERFVMVDDADSILHGYLGCRVDMISVENCYD